MGRPADTVEVREAIARLWALPSTDDVAAAATVELCRLGFDRAWLTRVSGADVSTISAWVQGDADSAAALVSGRHAEGRAAQSRATIGHDGFSAVVPVVLSSRVAGYFHADCQQRRRSLDERDIDMLVAFAEGFAYAYERSALRDRLRALRSEMRRASGTLVAVADGTVDATIALSAPGARERHVELAELLTRREMEVVRLLAAGKTNAAIAEQLVVTVGTVKSHVKHILHKLGAQNRAEAVSLYARCR